MRKTSTLIFITFISLCLLAGGITANNNDTITTRDPGEPRSSYPPAIISSRYYPGDSILDVAVSDDGEYYLLGSALHKCVLIRNTNASYFSWTTPYPIVDVDSGYDGFYSFIGTHNGTNQSRVYFQNRYNPLWIYDMQEFTALSASTNGTKAAVIGKSLDPGFDNLFVFNSTSSNSCVYTTLPSDPISVALAGNGSLVVTGANDAGSGSNISLHDADTLSLIWNCTIASSGKFVDISFDGSMITAADSNGNLYGFNNSSSTPEWTFNPGSGDVRQLALSENGSYLVASYYRPTGSRIYYINASSGEVIWSSKTAVKTALAISGDGRYFACGEGNGVITYYHRSSSKPLFTNDMGASVNCIDISSDGLSFCAGDDAGRLVYYDEFPPSAFNITLGSKPLSTSGRVWVRWLYHPWAQNYILMRSDEPIYSNGTRLLNYSYVWEINDTVEVDGTYYYWALAMNSTDTVFSNFVSVVVEIYNPPFFPPELFIVIVAGGVAAICIIVIVSKKKRDTKRKTQKEKKEGPAPPGE
ncbi:MAG: WD40 repeat domain-containing protein [Candidatus Hodarchaeota archaeon]